MKKFYISGTYFWPNGDKYEGQFEKYSPSGIGVFTEANGNKIESREFKTQSYGDKARFEGTLTYVNGDRRQMTPSGG